MADKAIDELVKAESINLDDAFVLQQNGAAKMLTGQVLVSYLLKLVDGHGGIRSIEKISTVELVDTYRITMTDGSTFDFTVTNGKGAYAYAQEGGYTGTEEEFTKKLAQGGADWNANEGESGHVLNRTHWVEKVGAEMVFDGDLTGKEYVQIDTDGTCMVKMSDQIMTAEELVGATLVVVMNGTETELVLTAADIQDAVALIGVPGSIVMPSALPAPFVVCLSESSTMDGITLTAGVHFGLWTEDGEPMYAKFLSIQKENIHKLDNKFIDAEWMATMRDKVEVYPETEYENYMDFGNAISHLMNVGQKICVTFSGTDYWCTGFSSEGMGSSIGDINVYFGNAMVGKSTDMDSFSGDNVPDTGEPFILYGNASAAYCMQYTAGTYSVGVYVEGEEPNRLPEKFLPEGYSKDELVAAVIAALPNAEEVAF